MGYLLEAFPGGEEERLVPDDGAAGASAELIPIQRALAAAQFIGEKIGRIQNRVPEVLEELAVKGAGPAFGHDVNLRAGAAVGLGRPRSGFNVELQDSLGDTEQVQRLVGLSVNVTDAIEKINIRLRTDAREIEPVPLRPRSSGYKTGAQ